MIFIDSRTLINFINGDGLFIIHKPTGKKNRVLHDTYHMMPHTTPYNTYAANDRHYLQFDPTKNMIKWTPTYTTELDDGFESATRFTFEQVLGIIHAVTGNPMIDTSDWHVAYVHYYTWQYDALIRAFLQDSLLLMQQNSYQNIEPVQNMINAQIKTHSKK